MASPSPETPPDTNSTASAPPPKISPATGHTGFPSSHPATPPNPNNKGLAMSAVIGITIGVLCFVFILVICLLVYFLGQERKKRHESFRRMPRHQDEMPDGILQHQQQSPARLTRIVLGCRDFSREELDEATNGFSHLLGEGGFGRVYKGRLPNGPFIAVKKLQPGSLQGEREFQAEVDAISRVHHKYLVTLIGYCTSDDERMLVYEFVPNNTLKYHLHGKGIPSMDWSTRMKIAIGSAKGLEYLHVYCNPIIIHRDIKASNILLDEDFEPKVADFGLAKFLSDTESHVSTRVMGTDGSVDPEYVDSRRLTAKSDVYSFGVVLLELITGRKPDKIFDLVKWARHLLSEALKNGKFDGLVDPRLQNYKAEEMIRMIACAEACVLDEAKHRPQMRQVVLVLEGTIPLEGLKAGIIPGPINNNSDSFDDDVQYNEDLKKTSMNMTLKDKEKVISEYSGSSSKYGQHPSVSKARHSHVSEYSFNDSVQSNEDLKKTFMNMTLKGKEKVISEYSDPSNKYGQHSSVSKAGHNHVYEYSFNDSVQSNENLKKTFMNMTLKGKEKVIREYSGPSSKYGHHPSLSTHPTR